MKVKKKKSDVIDIDFFFKMSAFMAGIFFVKYLNDFVRTRGLINFISMFV